MLTCRPDLRSGGVACPERTKITGLDRPDLHLRFYLQNAERESSLGSGCFIGNVLVTKVPFFDLHRQFRGLQAEIIDDLAEVCESQAFILGPQVVEFENRIAALAGTKFGIGTSSGTDAELLILMALGVGPGDAVITTPFTFFATAGSIVRIGAKPIFVDINPATFNLSVSKLEKFLANNCVTTDSGTVTHDGLRIRAVVPVHLFGLCCDLPELRRVCDRRRLMLVEDAAQALGASYPEGETLKRAGSAGVAGFFSFYPTKNLGAFGDAGMVVTDDAQLAAKMRALRNHGMEPRYYHHLVGGAFRMDTLQATILLRKLGHLEKWSRRRWELAQRYHRELSDLEIILPVEPHGCGWEGHIYHQFVIRTPERDQLRAFLAEQGIGTEIYYPLALHQQPCFESLAYHEGDLPAAEQVAKECLALPIFPELTDEEQALVILRIGEFFR
jgi:dTDP-4-amino-4,6-dideoxygalactose transaminase